MIFEKIRMLISEQMSMDENSIDINARFDELGADTLDIVELVMAVEQEFDIEIADEEVEKITSIKELVEIVKTFE